MDGEIDNAANYQPDGATKENVLGKDYGLLLAQARMAKQERDDAVLRVKLQEKDAKLELDEMKSNLGFGSHFVDPEMLALQHKLRDDELPILKDKEDNTKQKKYKLKGFKT
jgi:hypothetical protein